MSDALIEVLPSDHVRHCIWDVPHGNHKFHKIGGELEICGGEVEKEETRTILG